ncbi:MAG: hypothetical protein HC896_01460 [Bacteroidales bacterium]|nr:hypothetical protein [Bacteroidales bacterium]
MVVNTSQNIKNDLFKGKLIGFEHNAAKSALTGHSFANREYINGSWYISSYDPLEVDNKVEGILFSAVQLKYSAS